MTLYEAIIKEYESLKDWEFAGKVARKIAFEMKSKESNIERRMRELARGEAGSGKGKRTFAPALEMKLVKIDGVPNKVVCYKIKHQEPSVWDLPKKVE